MKHHRHAQHDPKRQLTKAHIAHIVGFMICRMGLEEVTPKFVRTVWNYIPKEEPPDALWTGIDYIKKHAARGRAAITGVEGVAADGRPEGGGECVGDHVMVSKMIMLMEQEEEKEGVLLAEELVTVGDMEQMVLILVEERKMHQEERHVLAERMAGWPERVTVMHDLRVEERKPTKMEKQVGPPIMMLFLNSKCINFVLIQVCHLLQQPNII